MAQTNRRYLLIVLGSFAISWPTIATIWYLFNISFCYLAMLSYAVNYIGFCGGKHFGDFEHQAFYYGLFDTDRRIREADVLFIGTSRMQFAFSHPNVAAFFSERHASFFLAGFSYNEGARFVDEVFKRHPPRPKILVINEDGFSAGGLSEPARYIVEHPVSGFVDAKFKEIAQAVISSFCQPGHHSLILSTRCGRGDAFVRSRETGSWDSPGFSDEKFIGPYPVGVMPPTEEVFLLAWLGVAEPQARELIAHASPRCVVFTDAPSDAAVGVFAKALSGRLNAVTILPDLPGLPGLHTYDRNHLDKQSAISWSNAFLKELDRIGPGCGAW